jgi:Asp-tRNA(Asn)/Glu-tRNA(Gln) amidotransferase A subunit family amidase
MNAIAAVERALRAVEEREPEVRAWAWLDTDRAQAEAVAVERRGGGPLGGVVLGVKDIFDTWDQPTECGTPIFAGRRPRADAATVSLLRAAGAVCLGKTVTAELASSHPGPTTNPHRATHTPGGSSMGSAAAVACGMADIALGTQTAGSIIRPASFCGVFGFKPTFGTVSPAGVKLFAPSLDTVGWFARTPELLDAVRVCLTGRAPATPLTGPPRIGVLRTEQWPACAPESAQAVAEMADRARAADAQVSEVTQPDFLDGLAGELTVMAYESARTLAWEHRSHRDQLSPPLRDFLDLGAATDPAAYDRVLARRDAARAREAELFGACDVLLTPAVVGEAPLGLADTGDPQFARLWTLLGLPTVAIPAITGPTGLPVGVQLLARTGQDAALLAAACWLACDPAH